jgi:hypothetical protein
MFDSGLERDKSVNLRRRAFLGISASAVAGAVLWSLKKPGMIEAASIKSPKEVTVVKFSDTAERLQKVKVMQIVKSDDEWQAAFIECFRDYSSRRY